MMSAKPSLPGGGKGTEAVIFHQFSLLPYEVRQKIWVDSLDETAPRVHMLRLHTNYNYKVDQEAHPYHKAWLALVVNPHLQPKSRWPYILGRTCRESREAVVKILPDTLAFSAKGRNDQKCTMRFSAAEDIIHMAGTRWFPLVWFLNVLKVNRPFEPFWKIQNLAIDLDDLQSDLKSTAGYWGGFCGCRVVTDSITWEGNADDIQVCEDVCREEPLPRFLACFPSLRKFYMANVFEPLGTIFQQPDEGLQQLATRGGAYTMGTALDGNPVLYTNYPGYESTPQAWPLVRCGEDTWFVIYDVRKPSPFRELWQLKYIHNHWRDKFPFYQAFSHLEINVLRCLPT
jgi:hypothetical protein